MLRLAPWMIVAALISWSDAGFAQGTTGPAPGAAVPDARPAPRVTPPPPAAGSVTGRQGLPLARDAVQRGQRTFKRCNDEALNRKYRGAERRHFVARCRLGYGRRLFRRTTPPA